MKKEIVENIINIGLCCARHSIPEERVADGYIFPSTIENPMDFQALEKIAFKELSVFKPFVKEGKRLNITVTGLTPALIAALNAATQLGFIEVYVYHYDRDNDVYREQEVL